MKIELDFEPSARECDGCTACCEGWLQAEALGKRFYPGQPCHWMSCKGCTVYEARPEVCSEFQCSWKVGHFLPEWFKPSESKIICVWRRWKDEDKCTPEDRGGLYLSIVECGETISSKCFTWLNTYVQAGLLNVRYMHHDRPHWMGTQAFTDWCAGIKQDDAEPKVEVPETKETTKPH